MTYTQYQQALTCSNDKPPELQRLESSPVTDWPRGSRWQRASHICFIRLGVSKGCSDAARAAGLNRHSEFSWILLWVGGERNRAEVLYFALPCSFISAHPHLALALPYILTCKSAEVYPIQEDFPKNNPSPPITLNMHSTDSCQSRRLETQSLLCFTVRHLSPMK